MRISMLTDWSKGLSLPRLCVAGWLLILSSVAGAVTGDSDYDSPGAGLHAHSYLGVGDYFGRWENGVVPIGYNHDGARSDVSATVMIRNIEAAFDIIEQVADIRFEFIGETTSDMTDFTDGLVVMGWENSDDGFAARAGPGGTYPYDRYVRLGYYAYSDGRVAFNSAAPSSFPVVLILHELFHLLGFGHSENPESIMTPSAAIFSTLQGDDIAALQALYGPPDVFVSPDVTVELTAGPVPGVSITPEETGFYSVPASSTSMEDMRPLSTLNSSWSGSDWVIFRVRYAGMASGTKITDYITLPSGKQVAGNPITTEYMNGYVYFFMGYVDDVLKFPGMWQTDLAIGGVRLTQGRLFVTGTGAQFNRTPSASLSVDHGDNNFFRMYLEVADPEGDQTLIEWMLPNEGTVYNASAGSSLWRGAIGSGARQMFGQVRDVVDRDPPGVHVGSRYGPGFASVVSRWLATPAEPNMPTFFTDSGILHIPSLDLEGTLVTANFKLTALDGIVLKFLEFDLLPGFTGAPIGTYRHGAGTLTLSKLIVYDQGQKSHFTNAVFHVIPDSSPIKIELISVGE